MEKGQPGGQDHFIEQAQKKLDELGK